MELFFWVLLGAAAGYTAFDLFNDDDDNAPEVDGDTITYVTDGMVATGGDGADAYLFDPDAPERTAVTIDAGAGDDIINLAGLFDTSSLWGAQLSGGDGNDSISVVGDESTISGGAGDDIINADMTGAGISGDDGNDFIRVFSSNANQTTVDGGDGNDTLDGYGSNNVRLSGGAGDDVILTSGYIMEGTGYGISGNGGDGNDTLSHTVWVFPMPPDEDEYMSASMTGGDGADRFEIVLSTYYGSYSPEPDDPLVLVNQAGKIKDFEPGIDQIEIDLSGSRDAYTAENGTLTEDTAAGTTEIVIRLTDDSLPDQDVRIVVEATGLSWSDVTFSGQTPGTLLVA